MTHAETASDVQCYQMNNLIALSVNQDVAVWQMTKIGILVVIQPADIPHVFDRSVWMDDI